MDIDLIRRAFMATASSRHRSQVMAQANSYEPTARFVAMLRSNDNQRAQLNHLSEQMLTAAGSELQQLMRHTIVCIECWYEVAHHAQGRPYDFMPKLLVGMPDASIYIGAAEHYYSPLARRDRYSQKYHHPILELPAPISVNAAYYGVLDAAAALYSATVAKRLSVPCIARRYWRDGADDSKWDGNDALKSMMTANLDLLHANRNRDGRCDFSAPQVKAVAFAVKASTEALVDALRMRCLHDAMDRIVDKRLRDIKANLWRPEGRLVLRDLAAARQEADGMDSADENDAENE